MPPGIEHGSFISHSSTLFVSNLAYDVTSTDLQTAFSDLAPVRSAFVVLEHGSGVSKGVGYVSFSIKEDAQTAFESLTTNGMAINGRNIRVQWAETKVLHSLVLCLYLRPPQPKNKPKNRPKADDAKKEPEPPVRTLLAHKVNDPLAIRTIVVSGLPSSINQKTLWKKLRKFEGAESVEWPAKIVGGEDSSTGDLAFPLVHFRTLTCRVQHMYCFHHLASHKTPSVSSTLMSSKGPSFLSRSKSGLTISLKPLLKVKIFYSPCSTVYSCT